jgi:hypothetical protein
MSSDASIKVDLWLTAGFAVGLYWFFKGFRVFRQYRLLMDTPEVPIRSVAMGLVEIHGKATGAPPVPSPVTQTPCYFYKVDIEHWVKNKDGGSWVHVATDADGKRFYLADATGRVLVDAHQAEYDLIQSAKVETGRGPGSGFGRLLSGVGASAAAGAPPGFNNDLWSYASAAVSRKRANHIFGNAGGQGERYRLTERLVVPEHWYDLTGTCVENPSPQGDDDRNMIVKGTNEPTFLITWRSEKEIRRTLRNRAMKSIFGGAALSVVCLGILLAKHGTF